MFSEGEPEQHYNGPSSSPSYLETLDIEPGQISLALGTLSRQFSCLRWPETSQIEFLCSPCYGWTKCWTLSGWEEVHLKTKAVLQGSIGIELLPSW